MNKRGSAWALLCGAGILVLAMLAALLYGPTALGISQVLTALVHPNASLASIIVWQIRLPRVVASLLVGGALAVAGVVMQALLRNPLADPYVIGASAGAGLGAIVAQVFLTSLGLMAPGAFVGALVAVLLSFLLTRAQGVLRTLTLILSGYAVGVIFTAVSTFLMLWHRDALSAIFAFEVGGLHGQSWSHLEVPGLFIPIGLVLVLGLIGDMNALLLGEEQAYHVGSHLRLVEPLLLLAAALLTASAVYLGGLIGFVGLVIPHALRRFVGAEHRRLVPLAFLVGAAFLVLADALAEHIPYLGNIPVGLITAMIGGPYFLYLLTHQSTFGGETSK